VDKQNPTRLALSLCPAGYTEEMVEAICAKMKKCLTQQDRKYRLKTYRKAFVGSEAVEWLRAELGTFFSRPGGVRERIRASVQTGNCCWQRDDSDGLIPSCLRTASS